MDRIKAIETYERLRYHFINTYIRHDRCGNSHNVSKAQSKFDIVVKAFINVFGTLPTFKEQKDYKMKTLNKIIIVLITIGFLTSCNNNKTREERYYERLCSKLSVVNYDGHDYIIYADGNGVDAGWGGICHSESCPCKNNFD